MIEYTIIRNKIMSSLEELKKTRLAKLELLKKSGMDPYPARVPRDFCLKDAKGNFAEYEDGGKGKSAGKPVSLAGRIMAIRGQGAILFIVLDDGKADIPRSDKERYIEAETFQIIY